MLPIDQPLLVIVVSVERSNAANLHDSISEHAIDAATVCFGRDAAIDWVIAWAKKIPYYTGEIAEELDSDMSWYSPDNKKRVFVRRFEDSRGLDPVSRQFDDAQKARVTELFYKGRTRE